MTFYYNYGAENPSGVTPASETTTEDVTQPRTYVYIPPGHPSRQYQPQQAYQPLYYPQYSYPYSYPQYPQYPQYPAAQVPQYSSPFVRRNKI
jgi:hypothetical protein